jgi:hypothetical protein
MSRIWIAGIFVSCFTNNIRRFENNKVRDERYIMRKSKILVQPVALAAAVLLVGGLSAKAAITLTLQNDTARAETGFTSAGSAGAAITANEYIGIYQFNSSGSEGPVNPFWSTCLSPDGSLDWNSHNYTSLSFVAGSPGNNPGSWSTVGASDSGIQNAQYLWRLFSPTIIASGTANQGAGLALAMYEALYDSTGYGKTDTADAGKFYVNSGLSGAVLTAYNSYLGVLNTASSAANVSASLGNGYVLRSTEIGAGQDLIWNVTPVPEPTTMIAGALLLLPVGASTLRILRKNRAA